MQEIRKVMCFNFDNTLKTSFWPHLGILLAQKLQNKIIPRKSFMSTLSLFAPVTSCKKSEQFYTLTFNNT